MRLESADFAEGWDIPAQYTCTGRNIPPRLVWTDAPAGTKSFALIVDDPDAPVGVWTHWLAYNIPASARTLPESLGIALRLKDGTLQGRNDFRKTGYGGPCPPPGHGQHRYFFRLYALDTVLDLKPNADRIMLERAMQGHVLTHIALMGRYAR